MLKQQPTVRMFSFCFNTKHKIFVLMSDVSYASAWKMPLTFNSVRFSANIRCFSGTARKPFTSTLSTRQRNQQMEYVSGKNADWPPIKKAFRECVDCFGHHNRTVCDFKRKCDETYSIPKHPFPFTDAGQRFMNEGGQEEATSTSDTGCRSKKQPP